MSLQRLQKVLETRYGMEKLANWRVPEAVVKKAGVVKQANPGTAFMKALVALREARAAGKVGLRPNFPRNAHDNPLKQIRAAELPVNKGTTLSEGARTLPPIEPGPVPSRALPKGQLRNYPRNAPENPLNQLPGHKN